MLHIVLRPRLAYLYRVLPELGVEFINLLLALVQFAACFGFYPDASAAYYEAACWMFFATSVVSAVIMGHASVDSWHETRHLRPALGAELGQAVRELEEAVLYTLSSVMFAVGSVLFLPEVTKHRYRNKVEAGTWCFLLGSFVLWFASFVNSLNVYEVGRFCDQKRATQFGIFSLGFTQLGSIAFAVGSLGYFPEFEAEAEDDAGEAVSNATCVTSWSLLRVGTHFYVIGAACYSVAATLALVVALIKRREADTLEAARRALQTKGTFLAARVAMRLRAGVPAKGADAVVETSSA